MKPISGPTIVNLADADSFIFKEYGDTMVG